MSAEPVRPRRAVDLFCGSGAVTTALNAGFYEVVPAVDSDSVDCRAYWRNHLRVQMLEEDIRDIAGPIAGMTPPGVGRS